MRPIDADHLKDQIEDSDEFDGIGVKYYINKEPTVDIKKEGGTLLSGKWYPRIIEVASKTTYYVCSNCHLMNEVNSPFCPNCGASMIS